MVKKRVQNQIERFKKILLDKNIKYLELWLFGSHARNMDTANSDVDLLVVFPNKEIQSYEEKIRLQAQLLGLAGLNGLNFDIIATSQKEFLENEISPILHQIRRYGVRL
ncbi:MAG: hypothetical protein A2504_03495 [Bdellovibrionales bacterium RIFOXYD12_FULL_39_22]|nr:MAG: hypothetical protein A2385_11245 [Bdellovibrionales bacterium RIFOXYB1_FULL_39_21]OFZ41644.1 MAG: hypothetical protein A2485_01555 [Bdellovibrionales bacterium RIFOXYC12_FULL_39_17]OFZ46044.1 MAG: hypothetical protein A2404_11920 [Bdellovibrionales bacterium RIFOXYC1_FULL_39_130]OFZ71476.1 MAG: hypothetical protein A2451_14490 [Bdellovibrionales bacterium RIFOXYC2_FULL_39_8]OFZ74871.1 MAG: hypothetical protein A2560_14960 [Bdellovibrionales bacterium RIFOXYD1_FULL_39_84]OFZ92724.1 MAG: